MSSLTSQQISEFLQAMLSGKKVTLGDILHLLNALIALEQKIEEAIDKEKDKKRREKIVKAIRSRNSTALCELLFGGK